MSTTYHQLLLKRRKLAKTNPQKLLEIQKQLIAQNEKENNVSITKEPKETKLKETPIPKDFLDWMPSYSHLHPKNGLEKKRVVVIGGGFAGLACAFELYSCGVEHVTVLEARNRVGGRVWTNHTFIEGKWVECGAELIGENHFAWRYYKQLFGLEFDDVADSSVDETDYSVEHEKIIDSVDAIARLLNKLAKTHVELRHIVTEATKHFDHMSLEDWIRKTEDHENIIGRLGTKVDASIWKQFRDIMENNNGLPCDQQSLLFNMIVFKAGDRDGLSFWNDSELYRCRNGNQGLADKIHEKLGNRVKLGSAVKEIHIADVVKVTYTHADQQLTEEFDFCVLAAPPSLWDSRLHNAGQKPQGFIEVTPSLEKYFPRPCQMGVLTKFLTSVKDRFWQPLKVDEMADYSWAMTWETTNKQGNKGNFCYTFFAGGRKAQEFIEHEKDLKNYAVEKLATVDPKNPQLAEAFSQSFENGRFQNWPHSAYTATGYSCPAVGEGPLLHKSFMDKMWFAGEHACRYWWSGFMEGALDSGIMVARSMMGYTEVGDTPNNANDHA